MSARIVEACAKASRSEDEFIRRVRREGFSIDPRLRRGTAKDSFTDPGQVVGYRITWRSTDGWTERFNAFELGDDMRLKRLRDDWADDARSRALAVQEWRAAMENRPPFLDDGRERHLENLSTHDMERLVSEAFWHRRQPQQRGGRRRIPGSDARGPAHVRHAARTLRNRAGIRSMEHGRL